MRHFTALTRVSAILAFAILATACIVSGQAVTGSILGRVTDSTGSALPGASVQIQNLSTGFSRTEHSDADGRYLSSNLPLGSYTITASQTGFKTFVRKDIVLSVGSEVTVNPQLEIGELQQQVEVTGEPPQVETGNATISSLVSPEQMRDLPLNGRSVDSLALLSPGIFANRASSANATVGLGLHVSVDGARQDWNLYLLDGSATNDVLSGRSSAAGEALGVEGILEFRLLTHSFSAEYGRVAGGIFSAVTRSGTNQFHGSAYEFLRNTIFDARNYFNPGPLPAFQRNQFGAAVGGPILKDRLFFFANYEGLRERQGISITSFVPSQAARTGSFGPVSPLVAPYLALYPLPTTVNSDGTGSVVTNFKQPTTEDYTMMRLDYKFSDKDSFFARFVYDPSTITVPDPIPTFVNTLTADDRFLSVSETHILSSSSVNEFRFSANFTRPTQSSMPTFSIPASLLFVPGQTFGAITFSGQTTGGTSLSALGTNNSAPQIFEQNIYETSDNFTKIHGAHNLKMGFDIQRIQINALQCTSCGGQYQFSSLANFLAAKPSTYVQQLINASSSPTRGWRQILVGAFIQDDFRVRPNLTLNLGLRYEFLTDASEVDGKESSLRNPTDISNTPGPPSHWPKANFAPRIGIAWDPSGSGKTSIRLAGGIYDNQLMGRSWFGNASTNAQFLTKFQVSNPIFLNGLGSGTAPLQQDYRVQYNAGEPTVVQWNLEIQRQLFPTLSLKVGYVGSHGYDLPGELEANTKVPTIQADGTPFFATTAPSINPHFASELTVATAFVSNYNGLQVQVQKTLSAGLTLQGSYTYSHALSEADQITSGQVSSDPATIMNQLNPRADYSSSAFDQRHTAVINGSYQLPFAKHIDNKFGKGFLGGWEINGIYSYGSGLPVDVLSGFNNSRDGDTNNPDRPNLKAGFSPNPTQGVTAGCAGITAGQPLRSSARWFDPCAFQLPAAGTFGTLGRNTVIGPTLSDLDFTLVKVTPITEKTKLEFRAECFNLLNHTNLGLPNNNVFSSSGNYASNAGQITTTAVDNRELQFGLKFLF